MVLMNEWTQVEVVLLENDGNGYGFGIFGGRSTGVVIKYVHPGGAAEKCGRLHGGDHILQINDIGVRGFGCEQVASIMRLSPHHLRLIIGRAITEAPLLVPQDAPIVATSHLQEHIQHINQLFHQHQHEYEINENKENHQIEIKQGKPTQEVVLQIPATCTDISIEGIKHVSNGITKIQHFVNKIWPQCVANAKNIDLALGDQIIRINDMICNNVEPEVIFDYLSTIPTINEIIVKKSNTLPIYKKSFLRSITYQNIYSPNDIPISKSFSQTSINKCWVWDSISYDVIIKKTKDGFGFKISSLEESFSKEKYVVIHSISKIDLTKEMKDGDRLLSVDDIEVKEETLENVLDYLACLTIGKYVTFTICKRL